MEAIQARQGEPVFPQGGQGEETNKSRAPKVSRPVMTAGTVVEVFHDKAVRVVSDAAMTFAQGQALAARIEEAFRYDLDRQHWSERAPLNKPLTVAALSREGFYQLTGDQTGSIAGVTTGPNVFAVPMSTALHPSDDGDSVIAHELGHVQDIREAGARISRVPIYLQEGKEYLLGDSYPAYRGHTQHDLSSVSEELSRVSAVEAEAVMRHFRTVKDEAHAGFQGFRDEVVGALFVEFLRTRFEGGKTDAIPRIAELIVEVGKGQTYDQAFRSQFGKGAAEAEKAFVQYVATTEGNRSERLRGTLYA